MDKTVYFFAFLALIQCVTASNEYSRAANDIRKKVQELKDDENAVARLTADATAGCSIDGKSYEEGATISSDNACSHCICHEGQKQCHVTHCFPHFCPRSYVPEGACCRQCACKDHKDKEYEVGQSFAAEHTLQFFGTMCMECQCQKDKRGNTVAHCSRPICPAIDNCIESAVPAGKCCPICHKFGQKLKSCLFGGELRASGSIWKLDSCFTCTCTNGAVSCSKNCPQLTCPSTTPPGNCCPICTDGSGGGRTFPPFPPPIPTEPAVRTFPPFPTMGDTDE